MAETIEVPVARRQRAGKGAARQARRDGMVPAVIYGDKQPPVMVNVELLRLQALLRDASFATHTYRLVVDGEEHTVLPRALQRHPVTDVPVHLDFLRLSAGSTVTLEVPCRFVNEDESPGLKRGGVLNIVRHAIEVTCRATQIPEEIVVDLAPFDTGDSIHISAVTLPTGVKPSITDRDFTIATIAAPSAVRSEALEAQESEADDEDDDV